MTARAVRVASVVAAVAFTSVAATQIGNFPWPPGVQPVGGESPVLTPEQSMRTFSMPPGYRVELVAAEPLVQDPIVMDFDADGRIWVIEMTTFQPEDDIAGEKEREPRSRVVVLEDTDDDGRADTRTVFAEGLVLPRSLKVLDLGVLIGEPPNLWLMKDTNGDLRADTRELVTDTYGRVDAGIEHNANSLFWALDNWIYTSEHDGYLRLKNGRFETAKTLARGQWGLSQDDAGRLYRNTNSNALYVDIVSAKYYMRNPNLQRTRGLYESLQSTPDVNTVYPIRPTPGVNRGYQTGILRSDGTLSSYTAVCSPVIYRGDRLPADLYGNAFLAEPAGNLVSRLIVSDTGDSLAGSRAYERAEFLASTDERFRPVWLMPAPDGTLYVVDMYRGIIQHRDYITEYLRNEILKRNLQKGVGYGRIYRVVHESTRRAPRPNLARATPAQLVAALADPNGWRRDMAQQLLVQRRSQAAVPTLRQLAASGAARAKLHALWTLEGMDALQPAEVIRALDDPSRDVRVSALRLSEPWLARGNAQITAAVLKRLDDSDWNVRSQLAATLGEMQPAGRMTPLVQLLERKGDDPVTVDAALSSVNGQEGALLDRLLAAQQDTPQRRAAITMVSSVVLRAANEAASQRVLTQIADAARAAWQRDALLRGAEVALLGEAMPGTPETERGDAAATAEPCPTCPGARGGPGGASAFRANTGGDGTVRGRGARGGGVAAATLTLRTAPAVRELAGDATLGARVTRVLERISWPGKVGAAPAAAALTPAEQQRFTAGQTVYTARCQVCHLPSGLGQPGVASPLVGSAQVNGPASRLARILLNGKEGSLGLMPPFATVLNDEQGAAVLTYVRRAWGNQASAVDSTFVARVRGASAGRKTPWTDAELAALPEGQ
jgi:mono/diheme cytochrome c family protein/glucose/arabinose dehydrogenase